MQVQTDQATKSVVCSYGTDVRSGFVKPFEFHDLTSFKNWLKTLSPVVSKIDSAYIVGAEFTGTDRTLQTMKGATLLQLDFDKPNPDQRTAVCATLETLNIGFLAFDSFSNGGKFVVLIPLSRPATTAEHRATMDYIVRELGLYSAGLDNASYNPVLPRFVSPNADSSARTFDLNDAPFLSPVEATAEQVLPDNVRSIAPIPMKTAVADRFQLYNDQASPDERRLFLHALKHNLIPDRVDDYTSWQPLLYAAFRGWAINSKDYTESQRELIEMLVKWSKQSSKYKAGCVDEKLSSWLKERNPNQKLFVGSILHVEVDRARLRESIQRDDDLSPEEKAEMQQCFTRFLGALGDAIDVIDDRAVAEAQTERLRTVKEHEEQAKLAATVMNRAPKINPRFTGFLDLVTEITTQGAILSHAEAVAGDPGVWSKFLSPIPVLMSLAQIASMGFMPHTMFRAQRGAAAFSLALWFLHIANQGTGKTEVLKRIHPILDGTIFKHSYQKEKFFSATGLWSKFETSGNLQLICNDEGEALFGKNGSVDGNLHTLHSASKQLKDEGRPNSTYCPNTQVQRKMTAMRAPTLMYNLAGTPALLKDIPEDMWIDGFMSRFTCVYLNPLDRSKVSEKDVSAEIATSIRNPAKVDFDEVSHRAVAFFDKLWREADHPAGASFFDGVDEIGGGRSFSEIVSSIQAHFESMPREGMPRIMEICDGQDDFEVELFADLFAKCMKRWSAPADSEYSKVFGALQNRAIINLQLLAAVLTLISDPSAKYLNYEITVWAEEFLFYAQFGVFNWLKTKIHNKATPTVGRLRFEGDRIEQLRAAILPGGLLYEGAEVTGTQLRNTYRSWRNLINDLKKKGKSEEEFRTNAEQILSFLNVQYEKRGNGLVFAMKPDGDGE